MSRIRIDQLLVDRHVFESRALARAAIEAGLVRADGVIIDKASRTVEAQAKIEAQRPFDTVSRAGLKLKAALEAFQVTPKGRICLDLGASTGGFTDVLCKQGALKVFAVDVGHDQLHPSLRQHPRVINLEGLDARKVSTAEVPAPISLLVADLSFIGLTKAIPAGITLLEAGGEVITLIKPQFEAGPNAGKRGIIRDEALHIEICTRVCDELASLGVLRLGLIPSPIEGGDGNREFLFYGKKMT